MLRAAIRGFPYKNNVGSMMNRMKSTEAAPAEYSSSMKGFHWLMAGGALACIGTVQYQQRTKDKKMKGKAMFLHKSVGLLMAGMILPRIAIRLVSKVPKPPVGTPVEHLGAKLSHFGAYSLLVALPVTGVAMGYYGGKGLPFFVTTIPGADKESKNGKLAGWSWKVHKYAGVALEYLLPIHVGAVGFHAMKGHSILSRITGGSVVGTAAAAGGASVAVAGAVSARPSKLPKFPFSMPPL